MAIYESTSYLIFSLFVCLLPVFAAAAAWISTHCREKKKRQLTQWRRDWERHWEARELEAIGEEGELEDELSPYDPGELTPFDPDVQCIHCYLRGDLLSHLPNVECIHTFLSGDPDCNHPFESDKAEESPCNHPLFQAFAVVDARSK